MKSCNAIKQKDASASLTLQTDVMQSNMRMDKRLARPLVLFLLALGALGLIYGALLYFWPAGMSAYFPWSAANPLTAVFVGGVYLAQVSHWWAVRLNRWSVARVQMPSIFAATATQLLALWLERASLHFNPLGWIWIAAQALAMLAVPVLFPLNERVVLTKGENDTEAAIGRPSHPLLPGFALGMRLLTVILLLIGLALFLFPVPVARITAWYLSPLDARTLGALHFGQATLMWTMSRYKTLEPVEVGLLISLIAPALVLIGSLSHAGSFDGPALTRGIYVAILLALGGFSAFSGLRARHGK